MFSHYLLMSLVGFLAISHIIAAPHYHENDEDTYRFQVEILDVSKGPLKAVCGGAIIHRRYILTSAQCVEEYRSRDLIVRSGGDKGPDPSRPYEETRTFHRVLKIYMLKSYNGSPCRRHQHDIALLEIKPNFDLSYDSRYKKLNLPEYDNDYEGVGAIVSGYAPEHTDEPSTTPENIEEDNQENNEVENETSTARPNDSENEDFLYRSILRTSPVAVYANEECQRKVDIIITESTLCTEPIRSNGEKCYESAGDPLIHDGTVVGILNHNRCDSRPTTFTRVSSYLHFIYNVIQHQLSSDILVR